MAFDPNRWTLKTQEAMQSALESARRASNPEVTPDHLLAAMVAQEGTAVLPVLQRVGVAAPSLRNQVEERLGRLPRSYGGEAQLSRSLRETFERADEERIALGDEYLSIETCSRP